MVVEQAEHLAFGAVLLVTIRSVGARGAPVLPARPSGPARDRSRMSRSRRVRVQGHAVRAQSSDSRRAGGGGQPAPAAGASRRSAAPAPATRVGDQVLRLRTATARLGSDPAQVSRADLGGLVRSRVRGRADRAARDSGVVSARILLAWVEAERRLGEPVAARLGAAAVARARRCDAWLRSGRPAA
jgi:hypothetical protein